MADVQNNLQREISSNGGVVGLVDYSTQKLRLSVYEKEEVESVSGNPRSYTKAKPLLPTLPWGNFVSAASLSLKSKIFDDGLYAAIELLVDAGGDQFLGKTEFIRQLLEKASKLTPDSGAEGLAALSAMELLRTDNTQAGGALRQKAIDMGRFFLSDTERSKPIGFYTWSDTLSRIFRRDRFSQLKFYEENWLPVINVLRQDKELNTAYLRHLLVPSRLTNPLMGAGMALAVSSPEWSPEAREISLFPTSTSLELRLQQSLTESTDKPLIDEIIARLRSKQISIVPDTNSGWYDHQLHALSALVLFEQLPEAEKLAIDAKYRTCLEELFKGFYALTRETHIKQLEMAWGSGMPFPKPKLYVQPNLTVEPLPTYYYRKSLAYRFINKALVEIFGQASLSKLHRHTEFGEVSMPLLDELVWIEKLFRGAAGTACIELGLDPRRVIDDGEYASDLNVFGAFVQQYSSEPELTSDCRMMVPIQVNGENNYVVWAFLGWEDVLISVDYEQRPKVLSVKVDTNHDQYKAFDRIYGGKMPEFEVEYCAQSYTIYRPVCAELSVKEILNRQEFQKVCNQFVSAEAIIERLGSRTKKADPIF